MDTFQDKVIIVTGASEGIGRALCLALAPQKPKLVLSILSATCVCAVTMCTKILNYSFNKYFIVDINKL
jgi:FlaA1/EpsC-like NDP-sugar epimerase